MREERVMRVKMISGFCGVALMLASGATLAQSNGANASGVAQTPALRPPAFPALFPNPTNNNGYEEWVQAGDLIRNNPKVEALSSDAEAPETTLAMKRRLLADPNIVRALQLVRAGLQKPVFAPRTPVEGVRPYSIMLSLLRLGYLLRLEQYVAFADGRVDKAIETLRVGLDFGHRIQLDSSGVGVIGTEIEGILLEQFSQHLDQLSTYYCDEVRRLVEDFLGLESPAAHLIVLSRDSKLNMLEATRSDPQGFLAGLDEPGFAPVKAYLTTHPEAVNAVLDEAENRINAIYNQALLNMRLPVAQRKPFVDDNPTAPGAVLFRGMTSDPQKFLNRYTKEQTQLRMLAVHALIHHYRWDHNMLPNGLAELGIAGLVKDSMNGNDIVYARDGDRYTLHAQGPPQQ
jgi:hypothetical protein